jgi:hypothetical protein
MLAHKKMATKGEGATREAGEVVELLLEWVEVPVVVEMAVVATFTGVMMTVPVMVKFWSSVPKVTRSALNSVLLKLSMPKLNRALSCVVAEVFCGRPVACEIADWLG